MADYQYGVRHVDYPDVETAVETEKMAHDIASFAGRWLPIRREVGAWEAVPESSGSQTEAGSA